MFGVVSAGRRSFLRAAAGGGAAGCGAAFFTSSSPAWADAGKCSWDSGSAVATAAASVSLASSVAVPTKPTVVLVHGLDSCKETWKNVLAELTKSGYPAVAFDLRGHGESPLGDQEAFTPTALANDIFAAAAAHGISRPFVLLGHSMGGRVAMRAAALDAQRVARGEPQLLAACIIEDMDIAVRLPPTPSDVDLSTEQRQHLQQWAAADGRSFASWEQCAAALLPWYDGDENRVNGWRGSRVRIQQDGSWWSDLNPFARRLAQTHVLYSVDGAEAWALLAATAAKNGEGRLHIPLHLWIADQPGTVCTYKYSIS